MTTEHTETTSNVARVDLSDGQAPLERIEILNPLMAEHAMFKAFKERVFYVVMAIAVVFLLTGLYLSFKTVFHLVSIQEKTVEQLQLESCPPSGKTNCSSMPLQQKQSATVNPSQTKDAADIKLIEQFISQAWLSTSAILTLIITVLAVGLTLLLTMSKYVFAPRTAENKTESNQTFSSLTTPIGSVLESFVDFIKNKFQK